MLDALVNEFQAQGKAVGEFQTVRHHHQNRLLLPVQVEQEIGDSIGGTPVEIPGRFVAQQKKGFADERPGEGRTLFLAPGELGRPVMEASRETDLFDEPTGAFLLLAIAGSDQSGGEDVLKNGALREQAVVLKEKSDLPVAKGGLLGLFERVGIDAVEHNRTRGGRFERTQQIEQGAFPHSGGAHDGSVLAPLEVQGHATQN